VTERRFNELRGEQVVYAEHRQERTLLPEAQACPLCPTRPGGPATEIPPESDGIAVFGNRFPAFEEPEGAAEVVVYTDDHAGSFAGLGAERVERLMEVWRERYAELGARPEVEYVLIFENRGEEVGVTLHHPHGQIYAFPFLPPVPAAEREADHRSGGCVPCSLLAREQRDGDRIVHSNDSMLSYVPHAARFPYEVHVAAREHRASLVDCDPSELRDLGAALQAVTRGYDALFDRPFPYMMCVHQAPTDGGADGHLHVELYGLLRAADRVKYLAGCEQGAGTFLVDALPERMAGELRAAIEGAGG